MQEAGSSNILVLLRACHIAVAHDDPHREKTSSNPTMSPDSLGLQDNDFPGLSLPQMSMHAECDCFLDSRVSERKFLHQQILKSGFADVALSQFTSTIVLARHDSSSLSEYLHVSGCRDIVASHPLSQLCAYLHSPRTRTEEGNLPPLPTEANAATASESFRRCRGKICVWMWGDLASSAPDWAAIQLVDVI
ncbi:hypothetical protein B0H13DRAFT_1868480 [Mycena leptocephala]|nr:hypothetical protein B0H13DRAFT_1868480 [Mycena leptocephala]